MACTPAEVLDFVPTQTLIDALSILARLLDELAHPLKLIAGLEKIAFSGCNHDPRFRNKETSMRSARLAETF